MEKTVDLIACAGKLIVKRIPEGNQTTGGILLAQPENKDIHFGTIESIGAYLEDSRQEFELGQTVVWSNYSGVGYTFEGEEYIIINQCDIIAIKK